jgi:hypothetical protein
MGPPGSPRVIVVLPPQEYSESVPDVSVEFQDSFALRVNCLVVVVPAAQHPSLLLVGVLKESLDIEAIFCQ